MDNLNPELMEDLDTRTEEEIGYFLKEKEEVEKVEEELDNREVFC